MLEGLIQEAEVISPITSEREYKAALAAVEPLLLSEPQVGTSEHAQALALVDAIDAYETAQGWNLAEPSEVDLVEFRRAQMTLGDGEPVASTSSASR